MAQGTKSTCECPGVTALAIARAGALVRRVRQFQGQREGLPHTDYDQGRSN